ncbi:MAG: hypothetical protein HZA00_15380 [Nitrospinae bacterium]|nr:hypothetical protein [Nitrospinota bacterium]
MKRLFFIILFLSIAFYPFAADPAEQEKSEQEEEAIEVTTEGVGAIKEDIADARRSAIDDALRIAVEQAKGVLVSVETEVQEYALVRDEVATRCKGFIKTYKILNENKDDKEKLYRISINAIVLLSNPKESAPVVFDEQKFSGKVPEIIRESIFISKKTNELSEMINTRRVSELKPEMLKKLHQRYLIMAQILNSIEPPIEKAEKHQMLKRGIVLKTKATRLYADFLFADHQPEKLKLANEINMDANRILHDLKDKIQSQPHQRPRPSAHIRPIRPKR